jgi:hypothetical protein
VCYIIEGQGDNDFAECALFEVKNVWEINFDVRLCGAAIER